MFLCSCNYLKTAKLMTLQFLHQNKEHCRLYTYLLDVKTQSKYSTNLVLRCLLYLYIPTEFPKRLVTFLWKTGSFFLVLFTKWDSNVTLCYCSCKWSCQCVAWFICEQHFYNGSRFQKARVTLKWWSGGLELIFPPEVYILIFHT